MIRTPAITGLHQLLANLHNSATIRSVGEVRKVVGLTIESAGPGASLGDMLIVETSKGVKSFAEVVGFKENRALLMPVDGIEGVSCGDRVYKINEGFRINVGRSLLGRVIDGLGRPLDGMGQPESESRWKVLRKPPESMSRPRIKRQFFTGVRSIDTTLACGNGQRVGIFAGSGVGKSTLLGMVCRRSSSDVNVIALIGERGKEVRDFIEESLGEEGMAKSVVVVVTSDRPALQRVKGAEVAMAIAEYFRDQGLDVFFMMDSLTRYAMAQREIGLAIGEPPATKGYPPSVFGMLPRLLERAGTSAKGTITAFCTVLVEGDDMNDPIADTVRGIVDGHIVLSRELAMQGHYPPVDILSSVSRVINNVATPEHRLMAQEMREQLSIYKRAEDLIAIGAYKSGSNEEIDHAIKLHIPLGKFLKQSLSEEPRSWDDVYEELKQILNQQ